MRYQYDMVVIGGGAAGLTAAGMSALLGAKTALIEEHRLGGDCTWVGCVPSKTLLAAAKVAHTMRTAARFGLAPVQPEIDFRGVMEHVRSVRQHVYDDADAPPNMQKLGVEIVEGRAHFLDSHTLEIQRQTATPLRITSRFFVIATGSRPILPAFAEPTLTNETVFELETQPRHLVVLGAGPVGIEMAQAFQRLGSNVTVVTRGREILSRDDADHARLLRECLSREGISFRFNQTVVSLKKPLDTLVAALDDGREITCDAVLSAIGREPAVRGLELENAGVKFSRQGIVIDRRCRTSQPNIFSAGDVTGKYQFTHMAEHMSKVAVTNSILRWPKTLDDTHVVWSTFTSPEFAHLGQSELQLREQGRTYQVFRFPFARLDRAITENETAGEVKVFAGRRGEILGVSILGANAGEMISEYALAMRHKLRLPQLAATIHPYPTYMLGNRRTADQFEARQLDSPLLGLLGRVLGYRGTRAGSRAL